MLLSLATVSLVGNVKVEDAKSYPLTTCVVSGEALDSMGKPMVFVYEERHDKNNLYSVHAPEVEYIAKGKIHQRYEFGVKASIATTSKGGWHQGAMSCPDNPYDGHTLKKPWNNSSVSTESFPPTCSPT